MDENITNVELEEENLEVVNETDAQTEKDELTKAVEAQMDKLRRQSLLLGAQAICRVILQKIYTHQAKPGKKSYRDYERLMAEIKQFCETGISRTVTEDGEVVTTEAAEETATTE